MDPSAPIPRILSYQSWVLVVLIKLCTILPLPITFAIIKVAPQDKGVLPK